MTGLRPLSHEFASAMLAAERAWYGTAMLARVRQGKGGELQQLVGGATPQQWASYLADLAGPAFACVAVNPAKGDMRVQTAARLGSMVVEMAWREMPAAQTGDDPACALRRLELFASRLQHWIDSGEGEPGGDLVRVGALVEAPQQRLALLAPIASALGVCVVMMKAVCAGAPVGATA